MSKLLSNFGGGAVIELDPMLLAERHPGVSKAIAEAMVEAAGVALARQHSSPCVLEVTDAAKARPATNTKFQLKWSPPGQREIHAWADAVRATEWAAEAMSIACVEKLRNLVVIGRAYRGKHVDFYVGVPGEWFEAASALEVSGTQEGNIQNLLAVKLRQAARNRDGIPKLAAVVRFANPVVMVADCEDTP